MRKQAILAGCGFGLLFGVMQTFTGGPAWGLFSALFGSIAFGSAIYWFTSSPVIKRQMELEASELLPEEHLLRSWPANLIVRPKEFGLGRFVGDGLLWTVGMKDKEALGGTLHLTNLRLVFKTHRFNRLRGKVSIVLPLVRNLENRSRWVFRKMELSTGTARVEFVLFEVAAAMEQIRQAQAELNPRQLPMLRQQMLNQPTLFGEELELWAALNTANNVVNLVLRGNSAFNTITNPLGAMGAVFREELFDCALIEPWQRAFVPPAQKQERTGRPRRVA